jgi:hypothetical protein
VSVALSAAQKLLDLAGIEITNALRQPDGRWHIATTQRYRN